MQNEVKLNEVNNEITDLDDSWIMEFDKEYDLYKNYYKEDINYIKLNYIYINNENCIEKIKEENCFFQKKNNLSREELLAIIKKNNIENSIQYTLLYILKYNIDIEPIYLKNYLQNKDKQNIYQYNFLTSIKNIDSICFQPTITLFHDINNLFFVFYTKTTSSSQTITKKIYINKIKLCKNKTLRNTYKDIK